MKRQHGIIFPGPLIEGAGMSRHIPAALSAIGIALAAAGCGSSAFSAAIQSRTAQETGLNGSECREDKNGNDALKPELLSKTDERNSDVSENTENMTGNDTEEPEEKRIADRNIINSSEQSIESYTIPSGSGPNTVIHIRSGKKGPVLYIEAGIHGDETAGQGAVRKLAETLSQGEELSAGEIYLIEAVNRYGAEHGKRTTRENEDINRAFPGENNGSGAEVTAAALFRDIREKKPDLVLDLHEARNHADEMDHLGESVIAGSLDGIEDLILGLITDSEQNREIGVKLDLFGSPPAGSINRTVTEQLHIPVITIETSREKPEAERIRIQLGIIHYVLDFYHMRGR